MQYYDKLNWLVYVYYIHVNDSPDELQQRQSRKIAWNVYLGGIQVCIWVSSMCGSGIGPMVDQVRMKMRKTNENRGNDKRRRRRKIRVRRKKTRKKSSPQNQKITQKIKTLTEIPCITAYLVAQCTETYNSYYFSVNIY